MDSFEVENFRSLKHLKLEKLARVNLLVGKNNSGKTSVLEALWSMLTIKGSQWLSVMEEQRGIEPDKIDFQYLFYGFSYDVPIHMKTIYIQSGRPIVFDVKLSMQIGQGQNAYGNTRQQRIIASRKEEQTSLAVELNGSLIENTIKFGLYYTNAGENWLIPDSSDASNFLNNPSPYLRSRACEMVATSIERNVLGQKIEELKVNKNEAGLLEAMRLVDARIQKIELLVGGEVYLDLGEDFRKLMPLKLMGEGVQRLLDVVAAVASTSGGVVTIDEIDNGLHYSVLRILWRGILRAAREYDVQIIATTHSAEALRHLTWVLDDEEYKDYRDDVAAYTLIRAKEDTVRSFRYNYEQLEFAMDNDIEVRN